MRPVWQRRRAAKAEGWEGSGKKHEPHSTSAGLRCSVVWPVTCMQVHIPDYFNMNGVFLLFMHLKDKIIVAVITLQSCKVLSHSIINRCAVFWHLRSLQTHRSITQTGFPG